VRGDASGVWSGLLVEALIRKSEGRILLLHERRELIEVLSHQRDVFLELNGLRVLDRRLKLRQALSTLPSYVKEPCRPIQQFLQTNQQ
jgi:hypothetical protein